MEFNGDLGKEVLMLKVDIREHFPHQFNQCLEMIAISALTFPYLLIALPVISSFMPISNYDS